MTHDRIMKNHPGRLQGKFSFKKVVRIIEVQHDTDGHGALRLYISKIFRRMLLYFSVMPHYLWQYKYIATGNILIYLKLVRGVVTFDLFRAAETRSVVNAL